MNTFAAEIPCSANKKVTAKATSNRIRDSLRASMAAGLSILGPPEGVDAVDNFWSSQSGIEDWNCHDKLTVNRSYTLLRIGCRTTTIAMYGMFSLKPRY